MEWRILITCWTIFYIRYSGLFCKYIKKSWQKAVNPSIKIHTNKIENTITFKIKTGCYLKFLTPETMKLLASTKTKLIKNKNGENVPYLEITEVILIHCNVVNNNHQNSGVFYTFVPNKSFGQLLDISPENCIF